jgi:hypothetical protein
MLRTLSFGGDYIIFAIKKVRPRTPKKTNLRLDAALAMALLLQW